MDLSSFDPLAILARDPELFGNIDGEEIDAPRKLHWDALDRQLFVVHPIRGDINGFILVLSSSDEEIYSKVSQISEISSSIVTRFLENFTTELDLNFIIDQPKVCPATQNFSVEKEFDGQLMNFQAKKRFIKTLQRCNEQNLGFQFEKMFRFKVQGLQLKFYFCLSASEITNINQ